MIARLRSFAPALAALLAVALPLAPGASHAADTLVPVAARVVWASGARVYLESSDPRTRTRGTRLAFVVRGRAVAAGEVERVDDGGLLVVAVSSGSLTGTRKLADVRVFATPVIASGRAQLVVGVPDPERASLAFRCGSSSLSLPPGTGYEAVDASRTSARFVRAPGREGGAWPDTLVVRYFAESTDEEIALERGEVDVAVFWPGELSLVMRRDPRWRDPLIGVRRQGAIAASVIAAPGDAPTATLPDSSLWQTLNRELFRGDLVYVGREPAAGRPAGRVRFEADGSIPGGAEIERFLNGPSPATEGSRVPRVRIYLDATPAAGGTVDLSADGRDTAREAPTRPALFALGCPVVCAETLRQYVESLGAGAFANLCTCDSGSRRR